ncbi:8-oxo-dGTP pyrophosphatase MutT (NUDIX family) [Arthrobacter stackebrandtii]|uniref:8-oxo-dGTP pyrophosphatase MutT (NUDIX family) n=1 Tax=Arthrobacter stackebrandtii TaxID=272161 RepID=A0ABS4YXF8_9MICC|nr:NUDIX hydrolase [Arthrobacter stackebrandtii]MBP2413463.1 8-oxo-dGTP pyrophosphatase MutT (NUDIX family) [Arthrobacter stackebrandtii]
MVTDSPLAPLEDACTVVLLRDGPSGLETLMLERPGKSRTFAGAWVFPGGKVDPADRVDSAGRPLDELGSAQAAGLRELSEETGQTLNCGALVQLSQWTPMQALPRRFRTWFMVARAASDEVVLNPEEHQRFEWLAPAEALARHAQGTMSLVPPTWVTLHGLAGRDSVAQVLESAGHRAAFSYQTHLLLPGAGTVHGVPDAGAGPGVPGTNGPGRAGNVPDGMAHTVLPDMMGVRPIGVLWQGDEDYPANGGTPPQPGARHRLTMTGLPWIFEHNS